MVPILSFAAKVCYVYNSNKESFKKKNDFLTFHQKVSIFFTIYQPNISKVRGCGITGYTELTVLACIKDLMKSGFNLSADRPIKEPVANCDTPSLKSL